MRSELTGREVIDRARQIPMRSQSIPEAEA